jgi:hypothetical protein
MKKRILVIEDEPSLSMAIRDELEFEGFDHGLDDEGKVSQLDPLASASPFILSCRAMSAEASASSKWVTWTALRMDSDSFRDVARLTPRRGTYSKGP